MAASSRRAASFFSAFYKWNRFTCGNRPQCRGPFDAHNYSDKLSTFHPVRNFAIARASSLTATPISTSKDDEPKTVPAERQPPTPADFLPHSVRKVMRNVPHPVVVLTAAADKLPDSNPSRPVALGIAVSSFNTVTLDPPTISFNIRQPSRTLDAIKADNGRFRIHFLRSHAKAARIADSFTRGNTPEAFHKRRELMEVDTTGIFSTAAQLIDEQVAASMQCELTQEITVADHIIAVARVSAVMSKATAKHFLMYAQGNYVVEASAPAKHRIGQHKKKHVVNSGPASDTGNPDLDSVQKPVQTLDPKIQQNDGENTGPKIRYLRRKLDKDARGMERLLSSGKAFRRMMPGKDAEEPDPPKKKYEGFSAFED